MARAAAGQADEAKADREAALQMAKAGREGAEAGLFELGETMDRHGDHGAEALWQRILEIAPSNTMYDANAMLRLAKYAEARGEIAKAAELYEKALNLTREPGATISFSSAFGAASPQDGAEWLRRHIRELKRKLPAAEAARP